jgi:hemoglobin/transferrin/lactoferrin receptor protein
VATKETPGYTVDSLIQGASPAIDLSTLPDIHGQSIERKALTGDFSVILRPTDRLSFAARFGRSYRHPNLEELLFAGPATVGNIVPNIKVGPERGNNLDFTLKLRTRRFEGSIGYFNNTYKGFISTEIVSQTSPTNSLSQAINFTDVRIQGMEADVESPLTLGRAVFNFFGNLAYNHGQVIRGSNPLTGQSLAGTPQDNITPFKAVSGLRLTDSKARYWAEYSNRIQTHVNRVAPTLINSPFLIAQDLFGLYGFTLHRLAWGLDWKREAYKIGLSLGIENLGNKYYREQFQFAPARGRSLTVGIHIHSF